MKILGIKKLSNLGNKDTLFKAETKNVRKRERQMAARSILTEITETKSKSIAPKKPSLKPKASDQILFWKEFEDLKIKRTSKLGLSVKEVLRYEYLEEHILQLNSKYPSRIKL